MASVAGDPDEVAFWRGLPATLAALKRELPPAIKARLHAEPLQPTELEIGILKAFSLGTSPSAISMNSRYATVMHVSSALSMWCDGVALD